MFRRIRQGTTILLMVCAAVYAVDYAFARLQPHAFADIPVDRMFEMTNRWGGVEFSVGKSGFERCVHSLFPHFGYVPCWYLKTQDVRYLKVG